MNTQRAISLSAVVLTFALAAPARADKFADQAKSAGRPGHSQVQSLFWAQEVNCAKKSSPLLVRQCNFVKSQRQRANAQQRFLLSASPNAVTATAKDKTVSIQLSSCIHCDEQGMVIVGQGAHKVQGKEVQAAKLGSAKKSFESEEEASHWAEHAAGRLRSELIVSLPKRNEQFKVGKREGRKLQVVGYRVYDPCDGSVLIASPASSEAPLEPDACGEAYVKKAEPTGPVEKIPAQLSPVQIKDALAGLRDKAELCHNAYNIDGKASFQLEISASGSLAKVEQEGDFVDTPTGICLQSAMEAMTFPKSQKAKTKVTYPVVLR